MLNVWLMGFGLLERWGHFVDLNDLMVSAGPKARPVTAQGIALGITSAIIRALKGRSTGSAELHSAVPQI
jgi:hypothetical protein